MHWCFIFQIFVSVVTKVKEGVHILALTLPVVTTVHVILGILLIVINMDVLVKFIFHCMINCDLQISLSVIMVMEDVNIHVPTLLVAITVHVILVISCIMENIALVIKYLMRLCF